MVEGIPSVEIEYIFYLPHMYDEDDPLRKYPVCDQVLDYITKHRRLKLNEFVKRWGGWFDLTLEDGYENYEWVSFNNSFKYRRRDNMTYSFFINYANLKEVDYGEGNSTGPQTLGTIRLVPGSDGC